MQMAVVEMKRIHVYALKNNRKKILACMVSFAKLIHLLVQVPAGGRSPLFTRRKGQPGAAKNCMGPTAGAEQKKRGWDPR